MILVLNFGGQYCHLIATRIRELNVYSEILPYNTPISAIKRLKPNGIILSGGPSSVYDKKAPIPDSRIFDLKIPILGICYGHQLIGKRYGRVKKGITKEYGKSILKIKEEGALLNGLKKKETAWMSHGDKIIKLNENFKILASTKNCDIASFENSNGHLYGVQFHPEVVHTPNGNKVLENFIFNICKSKKDFSIKNLPKKLIQEIKKQVKDNHVLMGISGGVDSTVASVLISKAIGKRLHCIFVDHGLIRKNELIEIKDKYKNLNLSIKYVNAANLFLDRLKGVLDPEEKRKIIGHSFIEVFEKEADELKKQFPNIKFLGQGTIYPDRIESAQPSKEASKIKSHHNLTLPEKMNLKIIEPLKDLYKDGVRKLGKELMIPEDILYRHPFPGPGLAIRILGEITEEKLGILRGADYIFINELKKSNQYSKIWQAFAALIPVKAVGVKGDARTYEYIITLRAVTSLDAMTADWARIPNKILENISNKILNEVNGVSRVLYDISQKPPATIEYE